MSLSCVVNQLAIVISLRLALDPQNAQQTNSETPPTLAEMLLVIATLLLFVPELLLSVLIMY